MTYRVDNIRYVPGKYLEMVRFPLLRMSQFPIGTSVSRLSAHLDKKKSVIKLRARLTLVQCDKEIADVDQLIRVSPQEFLLRSYTPRVLVSVEAPPSNTDQALPGKHYLLRITNSEFNAKDDPDTRILLVPTDDYQRIWLYNRANCAWASPWQITYSGAEMFHGKLLYDLSALHRRFPDYDKAELDKLADKALKTTSTSAVCDAVVLRQATLRELTLQEIAKRIGIAQDKWEEVRDMTAELEERENNVEEAQAVFE